LGECSEISSGAGSPGLSPYDRQVLFWRCLFVCLFVCSRQRYGKTVTVVFMKLLELMGNDSAIITVNIGIYNPHYWTNKAAKWRHLSINCLLPVHDCCQGLSASAVQVFIL